MNDEEDTTAKSVQEECGSVEMQKRNDSSEGPPAKRPRGNHHDDMGQSTNWSKNSLVHLFQSMIGPNHSSNKYRSPSEVFDILHTPSTSDSAQRLLTNCQRYGLQFVGNIPADGNCFFHAVSDQLSRLGLLRTSAAQLREGVVHFLRVHPVIQGPDGDINFKTSCPVSDWDNYLTSMSRDGEWADHVVLIAMANMLKHDIFLVTSSPQGTDNDNDHLWIVGDTNFNGTPVLLGHEWERHYRSLAVIGDREFPDEVVSDQDLLDVATRVNLSYEDLTSLYIVLGISHVDVQDAELEICVNSFQVQAVNVLRVWRKQNGNEATKKVLLDAISTCGFLQAKQLLERTWGIAVHDMQAISDKELLDVVHDSDLSHAERKALYIILGVKKSDVEAAERRAGEGNFNIQTINLLQLWRSRTGASATKQILFDSIEECRKKVATQIDNGQSKSRAANNVDLTVESREEVGSPSHISDVGSDNEAVEETEPTELDSALLLEIKSWRQRLKKKYKLERGKIRFGRNRRAIADIDDIFIDLSLREENDKDGSQISKIKSNKIPKRKSGFDDAFPNRKQAFTKLESLNDLFTIQRDKKGKRLHHSKKVNNDGMNFVQDKGKNVENINQEHVHHILLQGPAGSGKTTLISRIAYLWSTVDTRSQCTSGNTNIQSLFKLGPQSEKSLSHLWADFHLVFVIELRKITSETYLENVIQNQLLPDVPVESIRNAIVTLKSKCLILFDGFDEMQSDVDDRVLESPFLYECFIIFTTRPHMVDEFCQNTERSIYAHVQILGFSPEKRRSYIIKFFKRCGRPQLGEALIARIAENSMLQTLTSFPILLVMTCLLWADVKFEERIFQSMTALYNKAIRYLNKPFQKKYSLASPAIETMLIKLGKPAFEALLKNQIQIRAENFDAEILRQSFEVGITLEEEGVHLDESHVMFIHKTFQEFCAAKYFAYLYTFERKTFMTNLGSIDEKNVDDMEYLLRFCCGLCLDAVSTILRHVVTLVKCPPGNKGRYEYQAGSSEWSLPLLLLYEAELCHRNHDHSQLHDELTPLGSGRLEILNTTSAAAFSFLGVSKHNASFTWLQDKQAVFMSQCAMDPTMLLRCLCNMKSLTLLELLDVNFTMSTGIPIDRNMQLESLIKLSITQSTFNLSAIQSLLSCIPPPTLVTIISMQLVDTTKVDSPLSISCQPNKELKIQSLNFDEQTLNASTLMRLLGCMPPVSSVKIRELRISGEMQPSITSGSCEKVKRVSVKDVSLSLNSMLRLLGCMSSALSVSVNGVDIHGELVIPISVYYDSIKEFNARDCSLNAYVLMELLYCMSALSSVTLDWVRISGDLDTSIQVSLDSIETFNMYNGSMNANVLTTLLDSTRSMTFNGVRILRVEDDTDSSVVSCESRENITIQSGSLSANIMIRLLRYSSLVSSVSLKNVNIEGEADASIIESCENIQEFSVDGGSLNANTLTRLLGCMQSVLKVTLKGVGIQGEVDSNIAVPCESIEEFSMEGGFLSANTLMILLGCMSSKVTLVKVGIKDEVNSNISISCESIEDFNVRRCSLSGNTLMRVLSCRPSASSVELTEIGIQGHKDSSISVSNESVKELRVWYMSLSTNTLMRLLGCMPSVSSVSLFTVDMQGEEDSSILVSNESVKELYVQDMSLSTNTLMKLLGCMPSISSLILFKIDIQGEMDSSIAVPCESIKEFSMGGGFLSTNTLMRLLGCMSSKVTLVEVGIQDEVNSNISVTCESIKDFNVRRCSLSANTLMRLLSCRPSASSVKLTEIGIQGHKDSSISVSNESVKELRVWYMSLSTNTLMRLLGCMPSVSSVSLFTVDMQGEEDSSILVSNESVKELYVQDMSLSTNTLMKLLGCMPSISSLILFKIDIQGEMDSSILISNESVQKLDVQDMSLNTNTLVKLLGCMPSVSSMTLVKVDIQGKVDTSILVSNGSVKELYVQDMSLSTNTLMKLLACMPSISSLILFKIDIQGEMDSSILISNESVKELHVQDMSLSTNTLMKLLGCMSSVFKVILNEVNIQGEGEESMPSVTKVKFDQVDIKGEVGPFISVSCKSIKEFSLEGSLSANTLMRLLGCMPSVSKVTLDDVTITGEVGENMAASSKSIKELNITGEDCGDADEFEDRFYNISANTLVTFLGCLPSVSKVTLDNVVINDEDHKSLLSYNSREELSARFGSLSANTLLRLLGCMAPVSSVTLEGVDIADEVVDKSMMETCPSIKAFNMKYDPCNRHESICIKANTLMRLLGFMPSVSEVTINGVSITGDVEGSSFVSCKSIKELRIIRRDNDDSDYSDSDSDSEFVCISGNTLMKFIACMSSVLKVTLDGVELQGEINSNISISCKPIKEFNLSSSLSPTTIMRLLGCMPSLSKVKLNTVGIQSENHPLSANTLIQILGCVLSASKVTLVGFDIEGEVDSSMLVLNKSIKSFGVESLSLSANVLMRLLASMPSVSTVLLTRIHIKGEVDTGVSVMCKSIDEFSVEGFSVSANTLTRFLSCMPSVSLVKLNGVDIEGEVDPTMSALCESIEQFSVEGCSSSANTLMRLLGYMPSVSSVTLGVDIEGEVGPSNAILCDSIKELSVEGCSLSANSLMRLLGCMPSVLSVTLHGVGIDGAVDSSISVTCKSVTKLNMIRGSLGVNAFMKLFDSMPSASNVTLHGVGIQGEIDSSISVFYESIKELSMESMSLSASTLVRLLGCMSSVSLVKLNNVVTEGELDDSISVMCESIEAFQMIGKNDGVDFDGCFIIDISTNTLMRLLGCIPPASKVTLDAVGIEGELDFGVLSYQSMGGFRANCGSFNVNTLMRFLGYMPQVSTVTLTDVVIEGDVDESMSVVCGSIKEFGVKGGSLRANTLMRLLGCMPFVSKMTLGNARIEGEVDANTSVLCGSIKEFSAEGGALSANTLMRLLSCMPSVSVPSLVIKNDVDIKGQVDASLASHGSPTVISLMKSLGCISHGSVSLAAVDEVRREDEEDESMSE